MLEEEPFYSAKKREQSKQQKLKYSFLNLVFILFINEKMKKTGVRYNIVCSVFAFDNNHCKREQEKIRKKTLLYIFS